MEKKKPAITIHSGAGSVKKSRRADAPGAGPESADGPEPRLVNKKPAKKQELSARDKWILEQRPPHW